MVSTLARQVATANRRARGRGLEGSLSTLDWQRACDFFAGCAYCGGVASTIDHFQPMMRGGPTSSANSVPCCIFCNERKGATVPDQLSLFMPHERIKRIRGYLEEIGRVRQQSWRDLCARELSFAAMDRKTTWLKAYCEQQAHSHKTLWAHYGFLRMMLFGVEWDPAYYYQITMSLAYHSSSTDPSMQAVCDDLQHHLSQDDATIPFTKQRIG